MASQPILPRNGGGEGRDGTVVRGAAGMCLPGSGSGFWFWGMRRAGGAHGGTGARRRRRIPVRGGGAVPVGAAGSAEGARRAADAQEIDVPAGGEEQGPPARAQRAVGGRLQSLHHFLPMH
ncbi:hypothetical protein GCM10010303_38170 [Streptomyces purpurascens]|nr:hypothetical protein GCM10010303_38170 [Streptomyces purpurascens]